MLNERLMKALQMFMRLVLYFQTLVVKLIYTKLLKKESDVTSFSTPQQRRVTLVLKSKRTTTIKAAWLIEVRVAGSIPASTSTFTRQVELRLFH